MVSAIASQLEGSGFDSHQGRCGHWRRVPTSMSPVPMGLVVVGKSLHVLPVSPGFPIPGIPHKNMQ